MRRLKIIRITTVPISLKLLITDQMKFMSEQDFEVLMVSASGKEIEEVVAREKCPHQIIEMTRAITPFQDLKCLWALIQLFLREQPDIVHTHTPKAGLLGMLAAKLARVTVRLHTVAGLPLMTASGFKKKLLFFIEKLTYWGATTVLPNSKSLLTYISKHRMTGVNKLQLLSKGSSNGIDLEQFSKDNLKEAKINNIKQQIAYSTDYTYLLAVGRVVTDKGIRELISAFEEVNATNPKVKLILLGPIERERSAETLPTALLNTIETHPAIYHINWSDEVPIYMHLADVLIHASYREGFPNVLLQAGAMQCPIICSNIDGNIDIVEHLNTGLRFQVRDEQDLKDKLMWALTHPNEIKQFALNLYQDITENYNRKKFHKLLLQFYLNQLAFDG